MIKNIFKYIIAFGVTTIIFLLALIFISSIPKEYIENNIKKSSEELLFQSESIFVNSNGRSIYNHNSTDAIMLNIIYSIDRNNLLESVLRARRNYIPDVSTRFVEDTVGNLKFNSKRFLMTKELYNLVTDNNQKVFDYARYWHGYMVVLVPLLLLFDVLEIRIILQIILLFAFVILLYYISKRRNWKYSLIYLLVFLAFDLLAWITTIQGILVMIIAVMLSMFIANGKINSKNLNICLFFSGALTVYLDFFTTPIVTLLLPIITYKLVNLEESTFIKELINIIKNGIAWVFGYLGIWIMKWIITDLVLNTEIIKLSFEQIILRIGIGGKKVNENLNLFALLKNCMYSANILNVITFIITFISGLILLVKKNVKYYFKSSKLCYYICAIIPIAWFFIVANHSEQHYFFTYRTLLVTLLGSMLIVFDNRKNKENEDVKKDA